MRNLTKILVLIAFLFGMAPVYGQWTYDTLAIPKFNMFCTTIGDKLVLFAGQHKLGSTRVDIQHMELIDTRTGAKELIAMPEHQINPSIGVVGSKLLFAGGAPTTDKINIYDTLTKSWSSLTMSIDKRRMGVSCNDTLALFGGGDSYTNSDGNGYTREEVEVYNARTNSLSMTRFPNFPPPSVPKRGDIATICIQGKMLFAGGGRSVSYTKSMVNIYDVASGTWLQNTDLSQRKMGVTAVVYEDKVYFAGGRKPRPTDPQRMMAADTIDIYDPKTDTWDIMPIPANIIPMVKPLDNAYRYFEDVVVSGCKMFLRCGSALGIPDSVVVYDFARDTWNKMPLPYGVNSPNVLAHQNKVYFLGGWDLAKDFRQINTIGIYTLSPKVRIFAGGEESDSVYFAETPVGANDTIEVKIVNDGDYELVLGDIPFEVVGTDASAFTWHIPESKDTLQPLEEMMIQVVFSPKITGNAKGELIIKSNDPENPELHLSLEGTVSPVSAIAKNAASSKTTLLYPNPAQKVLSVRPGADLEEGVWSIRTLNGTELRSGSFSNSEFQIELQGLHAGIYLFQIEGTQYKEVKKLVVE